MISSFSGRLNIVVVILLGITYAQLSGHNPGSIISDQSIDRRIDPALEFPDQDRWSSSSNFQTELLQAAIKDSGFSESGNYLLSGDLMSPTQSFDAEQEIKKEGNLNTNLRDSNPSITRRTLSEEGMNAGEDVLSRPHEYLLNDHENYARPEEVERMNEKTEQEKQWTQGQENERLEDWQKFRKNTSSIPERILSTRQTPNRKMFFGSLFGNIKDKAVEIAQKTTNFVENTANNFADQVTNTAKTVGDQVINNIPQQIANSQLGQFFSGNLQEKAKNQFGQIVNDISGQIANGSLGKLGHTVSGMIGQIGLNSGSQGINLNQGNILNQQGGSQAFSYNQAIGPNQNPPQVVSPPIEQNQGIKPPRFRSSRVPYRRRLQPTETIGPDTQKAFNDYEGAIFQLNFSLDREFRENQIRGFNSTLRGADLFAIDNKVFGFEWRGGRFVRMPFPTYTELPGSQQKKKGASVFTPLHNRFRTRPPLAGQMDCRLYIKIVDQRHYFERFNRLDVELSSPCQPTPLHLVFLNEAGLRQFVRFIYGGKAYTFRFRTAYSTRIASGVLMEGFKEVRRVMGRLSRVNYLQRKYLDDYRKDTDFTNKRLPNGQLATPQIMFAHQKAVLDDMTIYYNGINEAIESHTKNGRVQVSNIPITENTLKAAQGQPSYIGSKSDQERQQEENERRSNFSMSMSEVKAIRKLLADQLNNLRQNWEMCKRICNPDEYYNSWNFCRDVCLIDEQFLSNTGSDIDFISDIHQNMPWRMIGAGNYILNNSLRKTWSLEDLQKLWNLPPVSTCRQTWSSLFCNLE